MQLQANNYNSTLRARACVRVRVSTYYIYILMKALKCNPSAQFAYNYTINVSSKCGNIISHRSSVFEGRHKAIDLRSSAHRSSIFESRHIGLRRSTHRSSIFEGRHIDLRRLKAETSHRQPNIAPTFRQFVTEYCPPRRSVIIIPKILRGIYVLYNYITLDEDTHAHSSGLYGNSPTRALVMY